jgi:2,4-dienoyl-CoA reductase-like NADH-dependent reductase (Old Yellow Enzyme family)
MSTPLSAPLRLPCGASLSNRLCKAALTEGLADSLNRATPQLEHLYRRWSQGGAGLIITGNVQIDRSHLERPGNVVIDGNGGIDELRVYAKAGTDAGNHLWMQINHPGRQTPKALNANPLAPSAIALRLAGEGFGAPRAATEAEILNLIRRFAHVASVARETGFTGVQIHAAHGYLISQFLSPIANCRSDAWGGGLANRARFLLETIAAVRNAVGLDFPVAVKLNSADFQHNGFSNQEAVQVAQWLGDAGIDLLELSGGSYEQLVMIGAGDEAASPPPLQQSTRRREAYFLEYASLIKPVSPMPVMVTGGFRTKQGMEDAIRSGGTDLVGLGRPMCIDPELPGRLLSGTADTASTWEHRLALAADALGPNMDPAMHRQVETWGKQGWFCLQLIRIGRGLEPDLQMTVLDGFNGYLENEARATAALVAR